MSLGVFLVSFRLSLLAIIFFSSLFVWVDSVFFFLVLSILSLGLFAAFKGHAGLAIPWVGFAHAVLGAGIDFGLRVDYLLKFVEGGHVGEL